MKKKRSGKAPAVAKETGVQTSEEKLVEPAGGSPVEQAETKKRTVNRKPTVYVIQARVPVIAPDANDGSGTEPSQAELETYPGTRFEAWVDVHQTEARSAADASKWLEGNGKAGVTYRTIALKSKEVRLVQQLKLTAAV